MDAASLVRRFQDGDETAFEELFNAYKNQALRTAFLICGNYCDSENAVQEAFIICYQKLSSLKNPDAFTSWFYRILTRITRQNVKKQNKEQPVDNIYDQHSISDQASVLDYLSTAETQALLQQAIQNLSLEQKTVIVLYYYNELSIKEIATATNSLTGTVKSRLFTARRNLRKSLQATETSKQGGHPQ